MLSDDIKTRRPKSEGRKKAEDRGPNTDRRDFSLSPERSLQAAEASDVDKRYSRFDDAKPFVDFCRLKAALRSTGRQSRGFFFAHAK